MKKFCSSASKSIVKKAVKPLKSAQELEKEEVYHKAHNILVVGETNFEFSKKLEQLVGSSGLGLICATSAHNAATKVVKTDGATYNKSSSSIQGLYNIRPMDIADNKLVRGKDLDRLYDRVVCLKPEDPAQFEQFLAYSRKFLSKHGQVHIFMDSNGPQDNWTLADMAAKHGYVLDQGMKFPWKKNDHCMVIPFSLDPNFKPKKEYPSYKGEHTDWEAFALQQEAEATAAEAAAAEAEAEGSGGEEGD